MSLNSDYAMQIITNQKLQDLRLEAAGERLARIARNGRQPWWQRLLSALPASRHGDRPGELRRARGRFGAHLPASHLAK